LPKPAAAPDEPTAGGYRKGDETRRRILEAALTAFGAQGFKGATTRRIADAASVNLPALKYYFGGKEGLYLACADEIVGRYRDRMLGPISAVQDALPPGADPAQARAALKQVVVALAELLVGTREAQAWTAFVLREMTEPGPAFAVLYEQVWGPGVDLIAHLISRTLREAAPSEAARLEALLLLSSISTFGIVRPVALRYLDWPDAADQRFESVRQTIEAQIDRLGV
jgi:AcrR family transcriptional regulator